MKYMLEKLQNYHMCTQHTHVNEMNKIWDSYLPCIAMTPLKYMLYINISSFKKHCFEYISMAIALLGGVGHCYAWQV